MPTIFSELRLDHIEDVQVDRDAHKKGLRTTLKLNLKALEIDKNPVDSLEKSKQVYSEYCRYNLTKPLDMTNVESVFKTNFPRKKNSRAKKHHQTAVNLNSTMSTHTNTATNDSSVSSDESLANKKSSQESSRDELEINAHSVKYKDIQEMNRDVRKHKQYMAKSKTAASDPYVHVKYSTDPTGREHHHINLLRGDLVISCLYQGGFRPYCRYLSLNIDDN